MDILSMTALELSRAIRENSISVTEAVSAYLERIEALNPSLNCYITVCADYALERAKQVAAGIADGTYRGALAGVPVAIKDNICTKGIRTTCASRMLENFIPSYDATVVRRLNAQGMILLGKLNMDEFAMGSTGESSYFGSVKNPWDTMKSAGGSSCGCAAAVAAGLAPVTLGSDTGGSVRQPASHCSVTGFKPSYSAVSRYGLIAYASSLEQVGFIARNAEDCAALFDVTAGADGKDMTSADVDPNLTVTDSLKGIRIGIANELSNVGLSPAVSRALTDAAQRLASLGAEIENFDFPELEYAVPAYYVIACAEASSNLARYDGVRYGHRSENSSSLAQTFTDSRTEGFGDEVKRRIMLGNFVLSSGYYDEYYRKAISAKQLITRAVDRVFERCDFILSPVAPDTAPLLGNMTAQPLKMYVSDLYTVTANLAGIPAISLPCGFDEGGMPVGVQLAAGRTCDRKLLAAARIYQQEFGFGADLPVCEKEASK